MRVRMQAYQRCDGGTLTLAGKVITHCSIGKSSSHSHLTARNTKSTGTSASPQAYRGRVTSKNVAQGLSALDPNTARGFGAHAAKAGMLITLRAESRESYSFVHHCVRSTGQSAAAVVCVPPSTAPSAVMPGRIVWLAACHNAAGSRAAGLFRAPLRRRRLQGSCDGPAP